jgi:hypothetical protein
MTWQPVRGSALRTCLGSGALLAALVVSVLPATGSFASTGHPTGHPTAAVARVVPADSDDDSDDDSDGSYTQRNTRCDPGYPEGVCVQSPTQSENNTTSEG